MWALFSPHLLLNCSRDTKTLSTKKPQNKSWVLFFFLGLVSEMTASGKFWTLVMDGVRLILPLAVTITDAPSLLGFVTFFKSPTAMHDNSGAYQASSKIVASFWWKTARKILIKPPWRPVQHSVDGSTNLRLPATASLFHNNIQHWHGHHVISQDGDDWTSWSWHYTISSVDGLNLLGQWSWRRRRWPQGFDCFTLKGHCVWIIPI